MWALALGNAVIGHCVRLEDAVNPIVAVNPIIAEMKS